VRHITTLTLLAGAAIGVLAGYALSQTAPQMRVHVLMQHRVREIPLPANLEVRDDRWDPGAETGTHDHPGPVILVVIEGELIEDTPSGRNIMRAGQAFWRPAHGSHNVKNAGSSNARMLAIHFDPAQ
jgi:quercetin dioxygenase-like cupin family protein